MLNDNSLPSAEHFRKHPASVAERLAREASENALRQLEAALKDAPQDDDGVPWLDLDEHSTPDEIEAAYRNTFERAERERVQPLPHSTASVIHACPLDGRWRRWDMFGAHADDFRWTTPEERTRCAAARAAQPVRHRGLVPLTWEVAPDDARHRPMTAAESGAPDWKYPAGSPRHLHAEVIVGGHVVHLDWLDVQKFGPGRSVREVRIFVDAELRGRGGRCGCSLGFGGGDLPAVARLSRDRVVTADLVAGHDTPVVELWEVAPDPTEDRRAPASRPQTEAP